MERDDQLEKFVRSNREKFDIEVPPPGAWRGIKSKIYPTGREKKVIDFLWKAAAIFFFGATAWLLGNRQSNVNVQTAENREFLETEVFYMDQIDTKMELISNISEQGGGEGPGGEPDLHKLDAMYQVLKEESGLNPSKRITDAMALNLLIRLDVLNNELYKLQMNGPPPTSQEEGAGI